MIEYAYTVHSPNKITEHKRINLKFFYIKLPDKIYTRKVAYINAFGLSIKTNGWFNSKDKCNYSADKRLEKERLNTFIRVKS